MNEEAALFGDRKSIVGVVTIPSMHRSSQRSLAVVLLNAGLVHRAGPGRIYVRIARALAALGFVVLRFDFSGIGDTPVRTDSLCFEKSTVAETREAMEYLEQTRGIEHFILMGGCSGAFASLETASCDSRVAGAVMINFQMPDAADETRNSERSIRNAAHYYRSLALFDPKSWRRLLTGKSDYAQLVLVLRRAVERRFASRHEVPPQASYLQTKLRELADRKTTAVFVCSQGDSRLKDLKEQGGGQLKRLCARGEVLLDVISGADHTFTTFQDQERLLKVICDRIGQIARRVDRQVSEHQPMNIQRLFRSAMGRVAGEELSKGK